MTTITGVVKKIHTKSGNTKAGKPYTKYSLLLDVDGTDTWVAAGFNKPPANAKGNLVEEGHKVQIEAKDTKFGVEAVENGIKIGPKVQTSTGGGSGGGGRAGGYTDRNTSIVIQSARKDAIALIDILERIDGIPVTKGKALGDRVKRYAEIISLVDKFTVRFAHDLVANISDEEFRVFGVVQDNFGEGSTAPLPSEAEEAPADLSEPPPEEIDFEGINGFE